MAYIKIGIIDTDRVYSRELVEAMAKVDGRLNVEIADHSNISKYDILVENHPKGNRISSLIKDIKKEYIENNGCEENYFDKNPVQIFSFLGVSGGSGTSTFAIDLGRDLARYKDKRVLYLSFEYLENYLISADSNDRSKVAENIKDSDYLSYYLINEDVEGIEIFFEAFTYEDEYGLERLYPGKKNNELSNLSSIEVDKLINILSGSDRYDFVFFDLGNILNQLTKNLLNYSNTLLIIDKENSRKNNKIGFLKSKIEMINDTLDIKIIDNYKESESPLLIKNILEDMV